MRKRVKPNPKKTYKPTYATAAKVARIAIRLQMPPRQLTYADVRDIVATRVSNRTIERYIDALGKVFDGRERFPKLEVEKHEEGRKTLVLTEPARAGDTKAGEELGMALVVEMLNAVKGTYLERDVREILHKFSSAVSPSLAAKLETLPRKLFTISYGVKEYAGAARERLQTIIRCLLEQQRTRVTYRSHAGDGGVHEYEFDPYTLLTYKGGLYLIGYSFKREQTVYLAVERIETVEPVVEKGKPYIFAYPEAYSPEKFTEGVFGIYSGEKTAVELRIRNAQTLAYLKPRRLHPTQKLEEQADGTAILRMTVRGIEELATWVMSMAPWVEVVKPAALRERVKEMLRDGLALYR
jgi:predicted DNA-binding transcriptional regulator YafY